MNKVFGVGLPKTGTSSLAVMLTSNNIPTVHFGNTLCQEIRNKMYKGIYKFDILKQFRGVTNGFEMIFPQLDVEYPDSKFINTIREKEIWMTSAESHWERMMANPKARPAEIHHHLITFGTYLFNKDRFSFVYDMHKNMVDEYFKDRPDDLLTIDITIDNEYPIKICDFLGIPCVDRQPKHLNKG